MAEERTIIVCSWQDCPFVADATTRFAEAHGLTPREREVFALLVDDKDLAEISQELVIASGTVKAHLHRIYHKTGTSGRTELLRAFGAFGRRL